MDLGNNWIRACYGESETIVKHSMLIENVYVYINKLPTPACLIDTVSLLGKRWMDQSFQDIVKYYDYTFQRGLNKNIFIVSQNPNIGDNYYLELPLTLAIKDLLVNNASLSFLLLSKKHIKLVCTTFEGKLNHYRLAIS
jgi:hypothetical protein